MSYSDSSKIYFISNPFFIPNYLGGKIITTYNKIKYLTVLSSIYVKTWRYTAQYPCHYVRSLGAFREKLNACLVRVTTKISKGLKQPCGKHSTLRMKAYVLVYADTYVEGIYDGHIGDQVLKNE